MGDLDIYTTDANPSHVYTTGESPGSPDVWVDQLARVSTAPVDLFVDPHAGRVVWTFRASQRGTSSRTNRYLADFRADRDEDLFSGLYTALSNLKTSGAWEFSDDDETRWSAGFDLARLDAGCPGLDQAQISALRELCDSSDDQVVLGMTSYTAALQTVKHLTQLGVGGTVAINSHGATPETDGIDVVLWPEADRDFQPMNQTTKTALERVGFRDSSEMTVSEATPSESVTEVEHQRETKSPIETFVGDTIGRIGAGLTTLFSVLAVAALADAGPVHPLSGLSAVGGLVGAAVGLVLIQPLIGILQSGSSTATTTSEAQADGGEYTAPLLSTEHWAWQQYTAFTGFWLLLAYAFPTIFRIWPFGKDWPFGEIIQLGAASRSAARYTGVLLAVTLLVYGVWAARSDDAPHIVNISSLLLIFALFAVGITIMTGFSCTLWYDVIGFTSPACP